MNLLLTTYLTKKGNPQGGEAYKPNNYELMSAWHQSVTSLDCDTIIIHDELSNDFTNEYEMRYYDPTFVKCDDYLWSANDARFQMFRDIVVDLDSADNIFMTDLFDVVVNRFPGEVKKDKIYVQKEPRNQPENPRSFWRRTSKWCQHQYSKAYGLIEQDVDEKDTVLYSLIGKSIYNPGVWGGSRNMVLKVLDMMIEEFKRIDIGERNGNMIVFNNVLYNKIGERHIVSGYPLHSKFKYYEADSDACFIHK